MRRIGLPSVHSICAFSTSAGRRRAGSRAITGVGETPIRVSGYGNEFSYFRPLLRLRVVQNCSKSPNLTSEMSSALSKIRLAEIGVKLCKHRETLQAKENAWFTYKQKVHGSSP
jgi:hypothetical protein